MKDPRHPETPPAPTANRRGHDNLIPAAASKVTPKREIGPGTDTFTHMKFVVWAMQQQDIDAITVRRVREVMKVSTATAQRLRQMWREMTARRFYRDSVPDIVNVLTRIHNLPKKAANDD